MSGSRSESWKLETLLPSSHFLDYIPGRDALVPAYVLAAGIDVMPPSVDGPHDAHLGTSATLRLVLRLCMRLHIMVPSCRCPR